MRKLFKKNSWYMLKTEFELRLFDSRAHVLNPFTPLEEEIGAACLHRHQKQAGYSGKKKKSKYNHKLKYSASDPWLQIEWICSSA